MSYKNNCPYFLLQGQGKVVSSLIPFVIVILNVACLYGHANLCPVSNFRIYFKDHIISIISCLVSF